VVLTGATGFVGSELLARLLERGDRHVYALVRAEDDEAAAARLPPHDRLTAVAADIERPRLGLDERTADAIAEDVVRLRPRPVPAGERRWQPPRGRAGRAVSAAGRPARAPQLRLDRYVAGTHRGLFREDELDVGQDFRNPYERSKFEAETLLRERADGLPFRCCGRASWSATAGRAGPRRSTCSTGR
jgi:nucleoside-diphosphate-sugar epimerase